MCSAFILNKINKAPEDKEKTADFDKIQYNKIQSYIPLNSLVEDTMKEERQKFTVNPFRKPLGWTVHAQTAKNLQ